MEMKDSPQVMELQLYVHTASALFWGRVQRALTNQADYNLSVNAIRVTEATMKDGCQTGIHLLDCELGDQAMESILRYARPHRQVPVILVGSDVGEEAVAAWMLRGASGFVHTDNLATLLQVLDNVAKNTHHGHVPDPEDRYHSLVEFFTNVSHELRTPLSLILMQMDLMRASLDNPQKMLRLIDSVTMNSYRLTRLVSNLLDLTKMEGGFMTLSLRQRDIVSELRAICDSVTDYAAARGLQVRFQSDVNCRLIDVDREKLDRIILNLLSNAIKHTGAGGTVTVGVQNLRDTVRIRVTDTGEGIPEDQLETIFHRFTQASNARNYPGEGCGIGLALVRSLTELHRGRVWVQSKAGSGSTFFVELPAEINDIRKSAVPAESYELKRRVDMELSDL